MLDYARDHLERLVGRLAPDQAKAARGALQGGDVCAALRFSGKHPICQGCNGLENAWKIGSRAQSARPGFLPKHFTLRPDEIEKVRAMDLPHGSDEVREALLAIWTRERLHHAARRRRARLIAKRRFDRWRNAGRRWTRLQA